MSKEIRILPSYKIPERVVRTTGRDVEVAGRDGGWSRLKEKSLGYRLISPDVAAFILGKSKPYAPGAGLDHMIFVAKKEGMIGSVADMDPVQLSRVFGMAQEVEQVYERMTDPSDPVVRKVVAVNYHDNPLDENVFKRKVHAQTLRDLHVHVTAWRRSDVEAAVPLEQSAFILETQEIRDVKDPFLPVVESLVLHPTIRERLLAGTSALHPVSDSRYGGINFRVRRDMVAQEAFAEDMIALHKNVEGLYDDIVSIFVDRSKPDKTGMPHVRDKEERSKRLEAFFRALGDRSGNQEQRSLAEAYLQRLNLFIQSGESVKAQTSDEAKRTPLFLRNFAYTLSLIDDVGEPDLTVNMSPRVVSTGNMLATLGLHKVVGEAAPQAYLDQRLAVELALKDSFSQK